MMDPAIDPLEMILRQCAATAPQPWYPSAYAQANGIPRDNLDPYLDRLRMGGLIHLTDWVQGRGQGYALTPEGTQVLESPRHLAQLRAGKLNSRPQPLTESHHLPDRARTPWDRGDAVRAALLFPPPPLVTLTLIFANVLWFLVGVALAARDNVPLHTFAWQSTDRVLRDTGAISADYIVRGEWWRLLSSCFVHIGLLHLGINMYSLWVLGKIQEGMWGKARFLVLYLIAGLGGSCAAVIFTPGHLVAGASGALFGLMSGLAAWIVLNRKYIGPQASFMLRQLFVVFVLNVFISALPGISAAAHFGGAAIGLVAAVLLHEHRFGHGLRRWLALIGVAALPVLCIMAVAKAKAVAGLVGSRENVQWWEELDLENRYLVRIRNADKEALNLYRAKIEPVEKLKPIDRTPAMESGALATLEEARTKLYDALELLQKAGPYRTQELEETRLRVLHALQRRIETFEETELSKFYIPKVASVEQSVTQRIAESRVGFLLSRDPRVRGAEDIQDTVTVLNGEQTKLAEAADLLRKAGPYRAEDIEKLRTARSQQLDAEAQLLVLASRCLQQGLNWTGEEQKELNNQKQRAIQLNSEWKRLFP